VITQQDPEQVRGGVVRSTYWSLPAHCADGSIIAHCMFEHCDCMFDCDCMLSLLGGSWQKKMLHSQVYPFYCSDRWLERSLQTTADYGHV